MEGIIKFETGPKPLTAGRSKFPYEEVIKTLQDLDSTKSIIFSEKECKYNNVQMLRKIATKLNLPYVKHSRQGSGKNIKVYLWMNHG